MSFSDAPPGYKTLAPTLLGASSSTPATQKQPSRTEPPNTENQHAQGTAVSAQKGISSDDQVKSRSGRIIRRRAPSPEPSKKHARRRPPAPRKSTGTPSRQSEENLLNPERSSSLDGPDIHLNTSSHDYPCWPSVEYQVSPQVSSPLGEQMIDTKASPFVHQLTELTPNMMVDAPEAAFSGRARDGIRGCGNRPGCNIDNHHAAVETTMQVGSYAVNPSLAPILQAINNKYGDIAADCTLNSALLRNSILEGICKVVQELCKKKSKELGMSELYAYYSVVEDAQKMRLNVKWLHQQLVDIFKTLRLISDAERLVIEKKLSVEHIRKDLRLQKLELERLKSEIIRNEGLLALEMHETEKLRDKFRIMNDQFHSKPLMDGLL